MTDIDSIRNPTLYEVSQMREDWGLEGEEDTHLVLILSFLGGGFVVMTGLSSGGKDACVNAAEYCVPNDWVSKIPTSMSKTVLYQKHEQLNNAVVHRHKDISNIAGKDWLEDIWKAHGDRRSITHSWTQVNGQDREERSQTILPPKCMVLFLASDNEQVDLNDYAEVRNRALVVGIDDSQGLTERVNERQADQEAGIIEYNLNQQRTQEIRDYIRSIPIHMYGEGNSGGFLNPVAPALDNQNPLPQHFTEARRDFPRLMDFMKSVTLFNYDDREEVPKKVWNDTRDKDMVTLLVTPADAWLAMRVFGEKMVLSALNLRDKDFHLMDILRENQGTGLSAAELQQEMRKRGWNITDNDVRSSMNNMLTKGYVRKDQSSTPVLYSASHFASQVSRDVDLDWPSIVEDTKTLVRDHYPSAVAEPYIESHCQGDGLLVTHPFEGHTVNLMEEDANELEAKVEEQEQKESDTVFGDGIQTDDDDPDGGQGTLT
jgi:hypothetical protein